MDDRCVNCNAPIRKINYALSERWMHVQPAAGFPTEQKGTLWEHCKLAVATPATAEGSER
jgi:hypothetical protein